MGAAYDLFGNGKTAVKFNLGKYMEAFSATNTDLDLNPLIRTTISTTRTWTDTNKDFVAELRPVESATRTANAARWTTRTSARRCSTGPTIPDFIDGCGIAAVQLGPGRLGPAGSHAARLGERRLLPQLVGQLVRRRQPLDRARRLHAVQHHGAGRFAAAERRRLRRQRPLRPHSGQSRPASTSSRSTRTTSREQIENWQGVDVNVSARLRNGLTLQGGTSTGRQLADACALKAALPEQGAGANGANTSIAGGLRR